MADAATATDNSYLDTLTARAAQTLKDGSGDQSGNVLDLVKRIKSLDSAEDSDPTLQKMRKKIATDQEEVDKKAAGVHPADVKPWDAKKEMAERQTDPLQAFGSFGSIFGILASAFTHQPMENALNASAAAIGAIHKGDEEAYKTAYDAWKENTNLAIERHKEQHEAFTDAMGKIESDASAMRTYAAKYGDQRAQILAESGLYQNLASMGNARQSAALQIMQAAPELERKNLAITAAFDLQAARKSGDPDALQKAQDKIRDLQAVGIIPASAGMQPPKTAFAAAYQALVAQKTANGEPPPTADEIEKLQRALSPAGQPRSAQAMAVQKFKEEHPNATSEDIEKFAAEYGSRVKAARDWGTGPLGNQTRSFDVGLYHLDTMQKLADALNNKDIQAFNRLANKWASETGQNAPTNFETAKQIIGAEVVKAIVGAGGGGVQERLEAANHIASSLSPEQLAGAIDTTKELMVGQIRGLEAQYKRTTKLDDFRDTMLTPEARELVEATNVGKQDKSGGGQEGATGTSKSGKPIVFRNGRWEYQ